MTRIFSRINTAVTKGIDGIPIEVETVISNGLPSLNIVGLPDTIVKESKERIRTALNSVGVKMPAKRITVNLSPADVRKAGSHLDLPIAVGMLKSMGSFEREVGEMGFIGELSLDGHIRGTKGVLPMIDALKKSGVKSIVVPRDSYLEAALVQGVELLAYERLGELLDDLKSGMVNWICVQEEEQKVSLNEEKNIYDYDQVFGQEIAKRAILIAACGFHNILLYGPPGTGKTMLAQRMNTILPDLDQEEFIEVVKIHSVMGRVDVKALKNMGRPFRSPHHTISGTALVGGGSAPVPGEITLAHKGIIFLDELTEFRRSTLEVLRQPMESKEVHITRLRNSITYPCDFLFVGAMNPCKCGHYGSSEKTCDCTLTEIERYLSKLSQPMLGRIDIITEVSNVEFDNLKDCHSTMSTADMKAVVERVWAVQEKRFRGDNHRFNAQMNGGGIRSCCALEGEAEQMLKIAYSKLNLNGRTYNKVLKIARTIADINGDEKIGKQAIMEALSYRKIEKLIKVRS